MRYATRALSILGLVVFTACSWAQGPVPGLGRTTNRPGVAGVSGTTSTTNPPSSTAFPVLSSIYSYALLDTNGVVIWPTNFWAINSPLITGGAATNLAALSNMVILSIGGTNYFAATTDTNMIKALMLLNGAGSLTNGTAKLYYDPSGSGSWVSTKGFSVGGIVNIGTSGQANFGNAVNVTGGNLDVNGNFTVWPDGSFSNAQMQVYANGDIHALNLFGTIDAGQLIGTLPNAVFPATLPISSGVNLTALNAANFASGILPIIRGGTGAGTAAGGLDKLEQTAEVSLASATTTDLGAQTSQQVSVTGTTTITSFGTVAAGTTRFVRFTGALTLTHNSSSLILPGGANITTAAGDRLIARSEGSGNWRVFNYTKADGTPVVAGDYKPGGTDVAIADGGTGQSTANAGLDALNQTAEATVASATTTDLGAQTSQQVSITGTTTITSFGTVAAGTTRFVRFTGALTLTHNSTSLILPGGASITTAAGDRLVARSEGSGNWRVFFYTRADGTALVGSGSGTGMQTNGGTGLNNMLTNLIATGSSGTAYALTVTNVPGAPLAKFIGTNGATIIDPGGGISIGGAGILPGASNLVVEGNEIIRGQLFVTNGINSFGTTSGGLNLWDGTLANKVRLVAPASLSGQDITNILPNAVATGFYYGTASGNNVTWSQQQYVSNINSAPMAPTTVKANVTGGAVSPQDVTIPTFLSTGAAANFDALSTSESTVASATTTDLGAVTSQKVSITGTTTITGFGTVTAGVVREGRFTGSLTLTHNATSLIIPGGANITTAAGDRFRAYSLGSGNWVVEFYQKADGTAIVGAAGGGDFSSNTGTSVDSEVVLFSGTAGKTGKRATQTGIPKLTSGVLGTATPGTDYYNPGGTDVAVADGGTGASSAAAALDNLITAEASVASATTTDLGAQTSQNLNVTGTTTITGFGTATAGVRRFLKFAAALTLTHNGTSLILPNGGANITTAAGDTAMALSLGSGNWRVERYTRADNKATKLAIGAGVVETDASGNVSANTPSGSGAVVKAGSPTITTPTISGAVTFPEGVRQSFSPDTTTPGLNVGSVAGDPSAATDGDIWYDNVGTLLRARVNGGSRTVYTSGGTDVAIADGGTGASSAAAAMDNLSTSESTVASATTTDLGAVTSQKVSITGTTTITGFGTVTAGVVREGRFTGSLTLTHNATSLIIPGGANITTAAGDRFRAYSLGSGNWVVEFYQKADGTAIVGAAGGGDFSSNTGTSVDSEVVLFSGTAGKTGKRATQTGIPKLTSGVLSAATAETDYVTPTGSGTLQNKTVRSTAHGGNNTLKFTRPAPLSMPPHLVVSGLKVINTNDLTADTFMVPTFSNSADQAANYIEWLTTVPNDVDTSVDPKCVFSFKLNGTDTATHRYVVSMANPAASAAYSTAPGTAINLDFAGDASGVANDVEYIASTTLTGWGAAVTANRLLRVRLARDGDASPQDASTVDSQPIELVIIWPVTQ